MIVLHHPPEFLLTGFAAGTLGQAEHLAVATHVATCAHCRGWLRHVESLGGKLLNELVPSPLAHDALTRIEARLETQPEASPQTKAPAPALDIEGLPSFVANYSIGRWRWVAPGVHMRPIDMPRAGTSRMFLLKSGPGTQMLQHSHTGVELTCVLTGSFSHDGGRFGPGDFDFGDDEVDHRPVVDSAGDCICLVAMQGELRLKGLIGRLMQPFIRL